MSFSLFREVPSSTVLGCGLSRERSVSLLLSFLDFFISEPHQLQVLHPIYLCEKAEHFGVPLGNMFLRSSYTPTIRGDLDHVSCPLRFHGSILPQRVAPSPELPLQPMAAIIFRAGALYSLPCTGVWSCIVQSIVPGASWLIILQYICSLLGLGERS